MKKYAKNGFKLSVPDLHDMWRIIWHTQSDILYPPKKYLGEWRKSLFHACEDMDMLLKKGDVDVIKKPEYMYIEHAAVPLEIFEDDGQENRPERA